MTGIRTDRNTQESPNRGDSSYIWISVLNPVEFDIEQWLKNKDTVLFLGVREQFNNPGFKTPEFEGIKKQAGLNSFTLTPLQSEGDIL